MTFHQGHLNNFWGHSYFFGVSFFCLIRAEIQIIVMVFFFHCSSLDFCGKSNSMLVKKTNIAFNSFIKLTEKFWVHFLTFNIFDIIEAQSFFSSILFETFLSHVEEAPLVTIVILFLLFFIFSFLKFDNLCWIGSVWSFVVFL